MPQLLHEDKTAIETRWWVTTPVNRFVYEIYVMRYYPTLQLEEYLSPDRGWQRVPVGGTYEPALVLNAQLVNVLTSVGVLDEQPIVDAIKGMVEQCIAQRQEEDGAP